MEHELRFKPHRFVEASEESVQCGICGMGDEYHGWACSCGTAAGYGDIDECPNQDIHHL